MTTLARWLLTLFGWKIIYVPPPVPKAVLIFYPHTSNWDFVIGILTRSVVGLPARYAAKDTLFRWPLGWIFTKLGGVPVNRREHTGLVAQLAEEFKRNESFYLVITPEGTRRATSSIKSGFYRLVQMTGVPLGCAFIDYSRREVGVLGYLNLTGNQEEDLASIATIYSGRRGKHPAQEGRLIFAADSARSGS